MDPLELINLALAAYKDKVNAEMQEQIRERYLEVLQEDARGRRAKASGMIMTMARLKISVAKLENVYSRLKESGCEIPAIEKEIRETKKKIKMLSLRKNSR